MEPTLKMEPTQEILPNLRIDALVNQAQVLPQFPPLRGPRFPRSQSTLLVEAPELPEGVSQLQGCTSSTAAGGSQTTRETRRSTFSQASHSSLWGSREQQSPPSQGFASTYSSLGGSNLVAASRHTDLRSPSPIKSGEHPSPTTGGGFKIDAAKRFAHATAATPGTRRSPSPGRGGAQECRYFHLQPRPTVGKTAYFRHVHRAERAAASRVRVALLGPERAGGRAEHGPGLAAGVPLHRPPPPPQTAR